jgi:HK97 family phage major capsid protein
MNIESLKSYLVELQGQMDTISNKAKTEDRFLTEEEVTTLEDVTSKFDAAKRQLAVTEKVESATAELSAPQRIIKPSDIVRPAMSFTQPGSKGTNGFKSFGHFMSDLRGAVQGRISPMLAATTNQNETTGADGGWTVPVDFRRDITSHILGQDSLLAMTDQYDSFSNTLSFPYDEVQSFTGTLAPTRTAEAAAITEHKLAIAQREVKAFKLAEAVNVTDEMNVDSPSFQQFVVRKVGEKFVNSINNEILNGAGVGSSQAAGYIAHAATKVVASGSGQGAGTLIAKNINDMYFAMPQDQRASAVWIVSPSVEAVLGQIGPVSGTTIPTFLPPGGLSATPYGTIMGRPYIVSPHAKALGTKGDISFVNLKKYLTLVKSGGVKQDVSIHAYFLNDLTTLKFTMRWGGLPWPSAVITWPDGSTQSPFVVLAAR